MIPATTPSANQQIARAAGTVMLAFVASQLIGLVRYVLIAGTFSTSAEMEAFTAANRVGESLFYLVAGGALASAFIPTFTGFLSKDDREGAWQLASAVGNLILIILIAISGLAAIFAPQIVRYLLAPGFAADPAKLELTVSLMRLMLPSAVIFGVSGLLMGILNSHQVFLIPALTPSMYSAGMIFGVVVLSPHLGIYGLAWGVLIGAILHLSLQIPALLRLGGKYIPILGLKLPAVQEIARLMGPRLFGVAVVQLNFWVNIWLASPYPGSVSAIFYAFTLMLMPQAAIAQSIAIAAMPTFSRQAALGKLEEMRSSLAASLRGVLLLSIPASAGLMLLREPLTLLLQFDQSGSELVAWALLWYAAGLVGHSVVEILARAFYSLHDTKTPVMVGASAMGINILLSVTFLSLFSKFGWAPHGGLALANSVATTIEMFVLLHLMRRRLNGIEGRRVLQGGLQGATAALLMTLALLAWLTYTSKMPVWFTLMGGIGLGGGIYSALILAIGIPEARFLLTKLIRKGKTNLS
ncbi:MAG: murein biosynthesis integral membrane protein MurJ [Anaerolineales bacterium]